MSLFTHIKSLEEKHNLLDSEIYNEISRPLPDFVRVTDLKKQKLKIKEELSQLRRKQYFAA